ncbi:MAG TPA: glycosyltransferase family 87 protein [Phycisphaerae bacterium]|nr:glycosyltransferase family 87 protein [Phycisphaerae bacterium]
MDDLKRVFGPGENRKVVYSLTLIVMIVLVTVIGGLIMSSISRGKHRDFFRWHQAAVRALNGEPLAYMGEGLPPDDERLKFYKLPPAFAVCIAPLGWLDYRTFVAVWYLSAVGAAAVSVLLVVKMVHGRWLPGDPRQFLLPLVGALGFIVDDLRSGNNNTHLLAMLTLAVYLAHRNWSSVGGLAAGLAISWKIFPAAALPALLLMRRWKLVGWSIVGVAIWMLVLPGAVRGYGRHWNETVAWYRRIVNPYVTGNQVRQWRDQGMSKKNQSLYSLAHRLCRPVDARSGLSEGFPDRAFFVNLMDLPRKTVDVIFAALVALGAAGIAAVGLRRRPPPGGLAAATDLAIACLFTVLASPIAWTYFYAFALPALVVGAHLAFDPAGPSGLRRLCAAAWFVSIPLILGGLVTYARAVGTLTWLGIVWFVVMLAVRSRVDRLRPAIPSLEPSPTAAHTASSPAVDPTAPS